MDHQAPDDQMISAAAAGDASAWTQLVDAYKGLVYSIPRSYSLPPETCDDVLQTSFFLLFRNLGSLRDSGGLGKWLITTTERECWRINRKRKTDRLRTAAEPADTAAPHEDESRTSLWEQRQAVLRALAGLDERCRTLLTMLFRDPSGASYDAISASLNIPRGSIGPQRARCLKRLSELVEQQKS
jgi:RNA polymerase sigma factor (sigma-70 family)